MDSIQHHVSAIFYSAYSDRHYFKNLAVLLGVLSIILITYYKVRQNFKKLSYLPTVPLHIWEVFGHIHYSLRYRFRKTEHSFHVYDFLTACGMVQLFLHKPLLLVWQFYKPFIFVTKPESVEMILSHSTEIQKAWFYSMLHPWLGTGLLTSTGEKWRHRRKLLTSAFHFSILKDFLPVCNNQAEILVKLLKEKQRESYINIVPYITYCSLDIICETTLGVQMHSQTNAESNYVKAVVKLTSYIFDRLESPWLWPNFLFAISPRGRRFWKDIKTVHDFANQVIADRKKSKLAEIEANTSNSAKETSDINRSKKRALLDLLLDEHIYNESISENDIREEVDTFTFEGHDTTSMSMCWTVYLLGLNPDIQEKLHAELDFIFSDDRDRPVTMEDLTNMKYLECVIKESLRLYPPVSLFGRHVQEDIEFEGYKIPKGTTCAVFTYMLHRNPEIFPNPEKFDPDRFFPEHCKNRHPYAYVPFSAGPRNCIGQRFALMEEKIVLSAILRNFSFTSLDPRDKIVVVDEIVLRPKKGLRLQLQLRSREH